MLAKRLSIRVSLAIAIIAMGFLAMVLAYISGEIYRNKAMDVQRATLSELLDLKVNDVLRKMQWQTRELVMTDIQKQPYLGRFASMQPSVVQGMLDRQFEHYLVGSGEVDVKKIYAYNSTGFMVQSSLGSAGPELNPDMCYYLRAKARDHVKADRAQTASGFCLWGKRLYFASVVPVGSFDSAGYIQVVTSPLANLIATEADLKLPLRITLSNGSKLYDSPQWPTANAINKPLQVDFPIQDERGNTVLQVSVIKDMQPFYEEFGNTSYMVMLVAAVVTILTIFIALLIVQKSAIQPLQLLTMHLRNLRQDKDQLGREIVVGGNAEVYELGEGFNEMTRELGALYDSLEHMAFTDTLTNLPNRTQFHDRLELAINSARNSKRPFALFIVNLDRFKEINYTLGHHVGDTLLQKVGERLLGRLGNGDSVARLGSDEFALLLFGVTGKPALQAARSLLDALGKPFDVGGQNFYLGASIGIATYPEHGDNKTMLLQRADVAMYAAKNAKSGFMLYHPDLDRDNPGRVAMMSDLRHAIEKEEFVLFYQPKVDLGSGHIHGVEALVRWQRLNVMESSPDIFIPILEQTGQIRALTQWVLQAAMKQCQQWKQEGMDIRIAVNLSTRDLQDGQLATRISTMLADHDVAPRNLELEITESAMMIDPLRSLDTLKHLSAMGINVTIDDFGTGYSSLSYLKQLPARSIKIDKSFVLGMESDQNDAAIVHSSIELAHNLGLKVIAEGVENEQLVKLLRDHNCDFAQGYYISQPMPAEKFHDWVKKTTWGVVQDS